MTEMGETNAPLLQIEQLEVSAGASGRKVRILQGVDLALRERETLGVVGESGSGKSTLAAALTRLLGSGLSITGGRMTFAGEDILAMSAKRLQHLRGSEIATILQDPLHSLTPWIKVGLQVAEPAVFHEGLSWRDAKARAVDLMRAAWIPEPEQRMKAYPHEMSGGMRQRAAGAIALCSAPRLLIADEPTTALDPTIQLQYLDLLRNLQRQHGFALILITHDLGVVARNCQRVAVMYGGRIIESGPTKEVMDNPRHPYTRGLLASMPRLATAGRQQKRLTIIPGQPPVPGAAVQGCAFQPRCAERLERCATQRPPVFTPARGRESACWLEENTQ